MFAFDAFAAIQEAELHECALRRVGQTQRRRRNPAGDGPADWGDNRSACVRRRPIHRRRHGCEENVRQRQLAEIAGLNVVGTHCWTGKLCMIIVCFIMEY